MGGDGFAELLRELKERSGLSYGVLGKRLHVSASTLHRYVNGDAVPADYAPVERLARICRATPEELVELHRRWVLADALRGRKEKGTAAGSPGAGGSGAGAARSSGPDAGAARPSAAGAVGSSGVDAPRPSVAEEAESGSADPNPDPDPDPTSPSGVVAETGPGAVPEPGARRRRRTVVLAGAAVVAAAVAAALVVNLVPGDDGDGARARTAGAVSSAVTGSPSAAASADGKHRSPSPSASRSAGPKASPSRGAGAAAPQEGGADSGAAAPVVAANPYRWEGPCSQHYLVDRKAAQVPPPPSEPDARGWVSALGGVAGGRQMVALTVQGTGKATVVLEALHVRVVDKTAPLAWNDYAMGVGCGGGVDTASFHVDLDAGRPAVRPAGGQRDFPYKVSESDPEVFYVFADARTHHVSWYLELDWSSGTKHGTVRVDDRGKVFRTSGNVGRPAYTYPLGSSEWALDEYEPEVPG
ncbi:helix-turn-helix domain-containing protein [Streptomyces sp. NPDC005496]|uniref:transcriptional regulator n=2 Tax=Streptomyces TaxID=1883 RepID=UPI00339E53BD